MMSKNVNREGTFPESMHQDVVFYKQKTMKMQRFFTRTMKRSSDESSECDIKQVQQLTKTIQLNSASAGIRK